MKKLLLGLVIGLTTLGVTQNAQAINPPTETEVLWQRHIKAWGEKDLDSIVADYGDDSVVILVNKIYRGKSEIRALFARLFQLFKRVESNKIDPAIVEGKVVYITWHARLNRQDFPVGTDTFVMDNGKIAAQTITNAPAFFRQ